jgi:hypothetical protein
MHKVSAPYRPNKPAEIGDPAAEIKLRKLKLSRIIEREDLIKSLLNNTLSKDEKTRLEFVLTYYELEKEKIFEAFASGVGSKNVHEIIPYFDNLTKEIKTKYRYRPLI